MKIAFFALFAAAALTVGCDKKSDSAPSASSSSTPTAATKADEKPTAATAPKADDAPAYKGALPSEDKAFLGLTLPPSGHWKPEWDADAKVAKWDGGDEYMIGIVIRIVKDKLDTIADLKEAAPMMMQLGSEITKVIEEKKTDKGWYAVVQEDKETELVYMRKFGKVMTVCSANIGKQPLGKSPTKEEAVKVCESYSPKG